MDGGKAVPQNDPHHFGDDWRSLFATMGSLDEKLEVFKEAAIGIAEQVVGGELAKQNGVDELAEMASIYLDGTPREEIEAVIGEAFKKAEKSKPKQKGKEPHAAISASPFVWRDPADIPPRRFIYGKHYVRQYLTCTVANSGVGKTTLGIVEALAMATGRSLLGITPTERARVWIWNGEDPSEELARRIIGAMIHYNIKSEDVADFLFADSGRGMPIVMATQTRVGSATIAMPVKDAMIATIKENKLDVLIIDPFVKSHRVSENDNVSMDAVATQWAEIADQTGCAIELLHHTRKTGSAEITIEDSRGASALIGASRSARVLNKMTKQEAKDAGIDAATTWRYFRVDNGKASMTPPPEKSKWYRLASVELGNCDDVGTAVTWTWPDAFAGIGVTDLRRAQEEVNEGGPWRANYKAGMWVGKPIAKALGLNLNDDMDRKKIRTLLATWISTGAFVVIEREGRDRHKVQVVEVGEWAN
jgi:hypothetical protein